MDNDFQYPTQVEDLLSQMTLREKIGQLNQYTGFWDFTGPTPDAGDAAYKYEQLKSGMIGSMLNVKGVGNARGLQEIVVNETRLGIPLVFGFDIIHGYKTIGPIPLAGSASWDLEAIRNASEVAAREASAAGIHWTFAPMMDVGRDARWGRVMEGAGEDPFLGSRVAEARIKGFQGDDLSSPHTIAACAKHFAGYAFSEAGRDYNTVDIGSVTLHNIVLPPFKAAVEAGVATVMNSFNVLNGVPTTGDPYLQRELLKGEWGFKGVVVSDWDSIGEMIVHGFVEDKRGAAERAILAGSDIDMESRSYLYHLEELVESGAVDVALIDDAVRRVLKLKYDLGLFDDPYRYCDEERERTLVFSQEHREIVRDTAKKSIVMLKNDNNLLPLKKSGQRVAVIGPLADDKDSPLGSWRFSADHHTAVSLKEALLEYPDNEWVFERGCDLITEERSWILESRINTTDKSGFPAAIEAAQNADVVLLVIGEHGFQSAEGRSRTRLDIPGVQQELMEEVYQVNQNIVLLLHCGRPLIFPWAAAHIPCILNVWQLGTESGHAIADVVMGEYNPSGKLPISIPRAVGQLPIYYNHYNTGRPHYDQGNPDLVFWSHYNDESNEPQYPFGYGLSYSHFEYSDLHVIEQGQSVEITVQVKNESDVPGEEVVQLYIRDEVASIVRPVKELKGFEKIYLDHRETRIVHFSLTKNELGFYNAKGEFVFEPGDFEIMVGGNSQQTVNKKVSVEFDELPVYS